MNWKTLIPVAMVVIGVGISVLVTQRDAMAYVGDAFAVLLTIGGVAWIRQK